MHFSNSPITLFTHAHKLKTRIACTGKDGISDVALALELAARATRINTHLVQAEEAVRKSRELFFRELCEYLGLNQNEAEQKWSNMDEEQKWAIVKGFVVEWGANLHPLSASSTREMVEEYLRQGNLNAPPKSPPSALFPGYKRIIGF